MKKAVVIYYIIFLFLFLIGFHNVDLCRNEAMIEANLNIIYDLDVSISENSLLHEFDLNQCHSYGSALMIFSFMCLSFVGVYNSE